MVTLLVGGEETPFNIHMDLLCKASPFFKSAFMGAGTFKETSEKSMKLPEDDPAVIDRLIQWIYFGCYPVDSEIKTESADQLQELLNASLMQFATLYVTADKYGIVELKNHVIDQLFDLAIQRKVHMSKNNNLIGYIYENTIAGSALRKLLVEWFVWYYPRYFKACWTEKDVADHPNFTMDVLARLAARVGGKSDPFTPGCQYKFHENFENKASDSSRSSSSCDGDTDDDTDDDSYNEEE